MKPVNTLFKSIQLQLASITSKYQQLSPSRPRTQPERYTTGSDHSPTQHFRPTPS